MSGARFTPGPWRQGTGLQSPHCVMGDRPGWDSFVVANTACASSNRKEDEDLRDTQEANARLIAETPAMYAALERVYTARLDPADADTLAALQRHCGAVLRRARGEEAGS